MILYTNINRFMNAVDECLINSIQFTTSIIVSSNGIKYILKTK